MITIKAPGGALCRAKVADTFFSRARGLMLKGSMPRDEGLLIKYSSILKSYTITGFFMRFSLDLVFLDAQKKVVDLHLLRPWSNYTPKMACRWVLEMNEGAAAGKVEIGDILEF